MSVVTEVKLIPHGNLQKVGKKGVLNLPLGVSVAGVPVVLAFIGCLARQWYLAAFLVIVVAVVGAALMLVTVRQGRNIYQRTALRAAHRRAARTGAGVVVAGPAGRVPDGSSQVPGLLTSSVLSEHTDSYGNRFGVIRLPKHHQYTVVIECFPDGDALVDTARVNHQVAAWGAWLGELGVEDAVIGASVTVETAPDPGLRLRRMVTENIVEGANDFATAVAADLAGNLTGGSQQVATRVAVTFTGRGVGKTPRPAEDVTEEIGNLLPTLLAGLTQTGAGLSVRACTAQDIADFTRVAYDPTVAARVEQARVEGGTGLRWADAGPVFADPHLDRYFHDRAVSKSWQMYEGPRGQFFATALRRALEPSKKVLRKRVTLLYRPVPAGEAPAMIEGDINNATFAGSTKRRPSARQVLAQRQAVKAGEEEAQGAGLVRFGLIVTATVASSEELPALSKVIPGLTNQARLRIRDAYGNQDVAFQAGLPLGLVLPEHMLLPDRARVWL
ncbi:SCO6880 family protein [Agromyces sp. NPDC058126]|uniref:SCO6880 family protein n=1 Tax=Agromyces sp. NPDC058126 TaxID=3346350 RepID=UPI0036DC9CD7